MPTFRFDRDFDYNGMGKGGPFTVAYKAGMVKTIPEAHATAAEAAGAGVQVKDSEAKKAAK